MRLVWRLSAAPFSPGASAPLLPRAWPGLLETAKCRLCPRNSSKQSIPSPPRCLIMPFPRPSEWGAAVPVRGPPREVPMNSATGKSEPPTRPIEKRVILSMGGKGGVGKTSVMTGLAEWFEENEIPVKLLDLDTENKTRGSLTHFFGGRVPKVDIHTPAGLDAFIDELADGPSVILADMGAGSGQVTYDWFDKMYPDVTDAGIVFTAIGV